MKLNSKPLVSSAVVLAATTALFAQETQPAASSSPPTVPPAQAPEPELGTLDRIFNRELPDVIGKSKISVNARLRYEYADQNAVSGSPADLEDSNALTIRTRFGLTSGMLYGFQGMIEGENVAVLGSSDNYNAAGSNRGGAGRTIIADPPTTELNQAWLSYTNWNTLARVGRQRIVLDNHRFVGDVAWRQNMQTFDAVSLENNCVDHLRLFYGYLWEINRVFGDVGGLPAAFQDFESNSHLVHVAYDQCEYGRVGAYSYLLDLDNDAPQVNSTASYGLRVDGDVPLAEELEFHYRAEFAWQNDYADNPADYGTEYYTAEVSATAQPGLPVTAGVGYEVLGSDNDQGFKTPLATLHAFNGWADVFLNTPPQGLHDLYGFVQVTLPAKLPLRVAYHKFDADSGSDDYGYEVDAQISRKLGKHWTALAKYAYYDGQDDPYGPGTAVDVHKAWAQIEFNF